MASTVRESTSQNFNNDVLESLVITGENFNVILDALDEEEDIQWFFEEESEEVS